jgi:hypothetical protein
VREEGRRRREEEKGGKKEGEGEWEGEKRVKRLRRGREK